MASARTKARPSVRSVEWTVEPLATQLWEFFESAKFHLPQPHLKRRSLPPEGLAWHDFYLTDVPIKVDRVLKQPKTCPQQRYKMICTFIFIHMQFYIHYPFKGQNARNTTKQSNVSPTT